MSAIPDVWAGGMPWPRPPTVVAFPDCEIPNDCACARRGYPKAERLACLVPGINREARRLGWPEPYPPAGSAAAKLRALLTDLEALLREGMGAALAGDLPAAELAVKRTGELLAIVRTLEPNRRTEQPG